MADAQACRWELVTSPPPGHWLRSNPACMSSKIVTSERHTLCHTPPVSVRSRRVRDALDRGGALCVVLVAAVARAGTPAECGAPAAMSDDWPVSPPAQQGLDPELICATGPGLAKRTEAAPHGVVVVRHGALVYEQYFAERHARIRRAAYDANTLHDIASITKGVVALLIGIAFDRGWLAISMPR